MEQNYVTVTLCIKMATVYCQNCSYQVLFCTNTKAAEKIVACNRFNEMFPVQTTRKTMCITTTRWASVGCKQINGHNAVLLEAANFCNLFRLALRNFCQSKKPRNPRINTSTVTGPVLQVLTTQLLVIGNESVPKTIINNTINLFFLKFNQHFASFKP